MTETEFIKAFGTKYLNELVKPQSKYGNRKCEWRGITFDSEREMNRFIILSHDQEAGKISDLKRQVKFELFPSQKDENGKVIERPCTYVADFTYRDKNGNLVVEDAKGLRTQVYVLKRKAMLYFHHIRVKEV